MISVGVFVSVGVLFIRVFIVLVVVRFIFFSGEIGLIISSVLVFFISDDDDLRFEGLSCFLTNYSAFLVF